jgi:hypothetical protein
MHVLDGGSGVLIAGGLGDTGVGGSTVGGDGVLHAESGAEGRDALANDILGTNTRSGADSGGNGLGPDVCGIDFRESSGIVGILVAKGSLGSGLAT